MDKKSDKKAKLAAKREVERKMNAFMKEYKALVERHFDNMEVPEFEPFGMHMREILPLMDVDDGAQITTLGTISFPQFDTDPPDADRPL